MKAHKITVVTGGGTGQERTAKVSQTLITDGATTNIQMPIAMAAAR